MNNLRLKSKAFKRCWQKSKTWLKNRGCIRGVWPEIRHVDTRWFYIHKVKHLLTTIDNYFFLFVFFFPV